MDYTEYTNRVTAVGFVTASKEAFADIFPRLAAVEAGGPDPTLEPRVASLEADEPVEDAALSALASEDSVLHVQIDGAVQVAGQAQAEIDAAELRVAATETENAAQQTAIVQLQTDLDADAMRITVAEGKISALQTLVAAIPPPVDVLAVLANAAAVTVGKASGKVGFFGVAPVVKQAALTAATTTQVTETKIGAVTVVSSGAKTVIDNHTKRINDIEARLKAYGLLP